MAGGVLIVAEHLERRIAPSTLELIATARPLAQALGDERNARIAVLGHGVRDIATHLAGYALDVLLLDHPALAEYTGDGYVQALRGTVESTKPRVILVAHTSQGYDFASALAGTMDLPLVTNCLGGTGNPEKGKPRLGRGIREGDWRRRRRLPPPDGYGLASEDAAGRAEREDGPPQVVRGLRHQRSDATCRGHEGRGADRRHQH